MMLCYQNGRKDLTMANRKTYIPWPSWRQTRLFQTDIFTIQVQFSPLLSKTTNQSQSNDFPFCTKNVFFLRIPENQCLYAGLKTDRKYRNSMPLLSVFSLFEAIPLSKNKCHNVIQSRMTAYASSTRLRKPAPSGASHESPTHLMADKPFPVHHTRIASFRNPHGSDANNGISQGMNWHFENRHAASYKLFIRATASKIANIGRQ